MSSNSSVVDLVSGPLGSNVQFLETGITEPPFRTQSQATTTSNPPDTESPHLSNFVGGSFNVTISATETTRKTDERLSSFSSQGPADDSHSYTLVASPGSNQILFNPASSQSSPETAPQNQPHVFDISSRPTSAFTPIGPSSPYNAPVSNSEAAMGMRPAPSASTPTSSPCLAEPPQPPVPPPPFWGFNNGPVVFASPGTPLYQTTPAATPAMTPATYTQSYGMITPQFTRPGSAPQPYSMPWQTPALPHRSQSFQSFSPPTVTPMSTPMGSFSTPMASTPPVMGFPHQNQSRGASPAVHGRTPPARKRTNSFVAHSPFHHSTRVRKEDDPTDGLTFDDIEMPNTFAVATPSTWDIPHSATGSGSPHASPSQRPWPPQSQTVPLPSTSPWASTPSLQNQRLFQPGSSRMPWYAAPPVPGELSPLHYLSPAPLPIQHKSFWSRVLRWPFGRMSRPVASSPHVAFVIPSAASSIDSASSFDSFDQSITKIGDFVVNELPGQVYLHFLLRLPALYFTRVARIFEEADLTLSELKEMAVETALQGMENQFDIEPANAPPQYEKLKSTWESFIDSVMREWKTFNIISVLLLSAILTILQIETAADDPVTRYAALFSLICALISLLFGCMYIIRFGSMRKTYKAAEWALEAKKTKSVIWWNVWVLLAMPAVWLTWSIVLYIVCVMSFIWRTNSQDMTLPPNISHQGVLAIRITLSAVLIMGIIYGIMILRTFRHYGETMDKAWKSRINEWVEKKAGHVPTFSDVPYPNFGTPSSHVSRTPWATPPPGLPTQGQHGPTTWGTPLWDGWPVPHSPWVQPERQTTANAYGNQEFPPTQGFHSYNSPMMTVPGQLPAGFVPQVFTDHQGVRTPLVDNTGFPSGVGIGFGPVIPPVVPSPVSDSDGGGDEKQTVYGNPIRDRRREREQEWENFGVGPPQSWSYSPMSRRVPFIPSPSSFLDDDMMPMGSLNLPFSSGTSTSGPTIKSGMSIYGPPLVGPSSSMQMRAGSPRNLPPSTPFTSSNPLVGDEKDKRDEDEDGGDVIDATTAQNTYLNATIGKGAGASGDGDGDKRPAHRRRS